MKSNTDGTILEFLYGSHSFEGGVWFGENHPVYTGKFWWRPILRKAMEEYASQQAPAMYTREQVEAAFDAGMGYEYWVNFRHPQKNIQNKQQFIQSLK